MMQKERLADSKKDAIEHLPLFGNFTEVHLAYDERAVKVHTRIRVRNPNYQLDTVYGDRNSRVITTTVGRVFFNEILPSKMGFINKLVDKNYLSGLIWQCYHVSGHEATVKVLESCLQ